MPWLWIAIGVHVLLAAALTGYVLAHPRGPTAMLSWVLALWFVPLFGVGLYLLVGATRVERRAQRTHALAVERHLHATKSAISLLQVDGARVEAARLDRWRALAELGERLTDSPPVNGNTVAYYDDEEAGHERLLEVIESAQCHIHMVFYIWLPDVTGRAVLNALRRKAREGVACRVLLDAVGGMDFGYEFRQLAEEAGVQVAWFMPVRPHRRWGVHHLRNHRKIVVVDGRRVFTGSQNIGDFSRGHGKLRPYHQANLCIEGPAAHFYQRVFAEDWQPYTGEMLSAADHYPEIEPHGDETLQVVATGPHQEARILERILMEALRQAHDTVWLAVPYFVPSESVLTALCQASFRGVDVHLVVPRQCDKRAVIWAARSYYPDLVCNGVHVYEYPEGMLHSKLLSVDREWCMVGSANFDMRSFRLNFEISTLAYSQRLAEAVEATVARYAGASPEVTPEAMAARKWPVKLWSGAARLLASQL